MTERPIDPITIQQQEQQHVERNRSAVQRALQHARHEAQHETPKPTRELADAGPAPSRCNAPLSDRLSREPPGEAKEI